MADAAHAPDPHRRALILAPADPPALWAERLPDLPRLDPATAAAELTGALPSADAILVDGRVEAPLSLIRRIRRLAPRAQVVLVADGERADELKRAMHYTPGLGELWFVTPTEVEPGLLERAMSVGEQRRSHARQLQRVSRRVEDLRPDSGRRPILSDQYLATLLELLPEPVLALGEGDVVLFANPAARGVLGLVGSGGDTGGALREMLAPEDPAALDRLLERGREAVVRGRLVLHPGDGGRRTYDTAVAPVAGERPVRALVLHDLTAEVEARQLLERRTVELQQAISHRSRFYANMSHELRTPINAIMGYNQLLLDGVFGELPEKQRDALDRIRLAARHLLDLVNDVLDLSKIEAGKIGLEPEEVRIEELVVDLGATMEPLAREHDVEIRFHVECDRSFRTDPRRLRQILLNLLSNAIRYGAGNPVDVRCGLRDGTLSVAVHDRGPGIPAERIEEIFDEFVQVGNPQSGGTGLGLPISRALARAMGGDLTVESEPGAGSTFTLRVPELQEPRTVE